jgi:hypothetical protein
MPEPTTLGSWLRRERERRGVTLATIAEETKVGAQLLRGLEGDDLSRWPGGIFRRSFVRSYATAIGLDPELVLKRVEEEHPSEMAEPDVAKAAVPEGTPAVEAAVVRQRATPASAPRTRIQAALLELLVAVALGLGFAAAGSRLLWPVIVIALYHAAGIVLAGTSPMMALLSHAPAFLAGTPADQPIEAQTEESRAAAPRRPEPEKDSRQRRAPRPRRGPARPDQNAARR